MEFYSIQILISHNHLKYIILPIFLLKKIGDISFNYLKTVSKDIKSGLYMF